MKTLLSIFLVAAVLCVTSVRADDLQATPLLGGDLETQFGLNTAGSETGSGGGTTVITVGGVCLGGVVARNCTFTAGCIGLGCLVSCP